MKRSDLDYLATLIAYSPKCKKTMRFVGPEMWLAEEAESRPAIASFECPGPTITLLGDMLQKRHQLRMTVQWQDGVTGAFEYLSVKQLADGLKPRIEETVRAIGLRCEVMDSAHFERSAKRLAAWGALIRYLHPMQSISSWPLCGQIDDLIVRQGPRSISEVSQVIKVDAERVLTATAHLLHTGVLLFNDERGLYDIRSRLRSASP